MPPGASPVVVLDNGGGLLKVGMGGDRDPVAVVPNCLARLPTSSSKQGRWVMADQLFSPENDVTGASLRRPIDRGYLVNPDLQRDIWDRALRSLLRLDLSSSPSSLLLTEPLFTPPSLQRATDELVFEDLGFRSLCVADPPMLAHLYETSCRPHLFRTPQCSLVVDCGFSFCHAAPVLQNFTLNYAARRLDLGGKALTNLLKELVSYRSLNVMDETLLLDDAKEKLCFVSLDVPRDLRLARKSGRENPFRCTYVLPDGITHTKGYVKCLNEAQRCRAILYDTTAPQTGTQKLTDNQYEMGSTEDGSKNNLAQNEFALTNERFLVPEMLFRPADLGMNQAGLAELIVRAIKACHPYLHPVLFESIVLTGGSTLFPHFTERLENELRPLAPSNCQVKITAQENPIVGVWRGGSLLASSPDFESMCVTKAEYEEMGSARCRRRFYR